MKTILMSLAFLAFAGTTGAVAGPIRPVGKWCIGDQQALCPGTPDWGAGLGNCLRAHAPQVSPACKAHHPRLFGAVAPVGVYMGH
jgi:hypothetical protein